jgi:hypothetical protein
VFQFFKILSHLYDDDDDDGSFTKVRAVREETYNYLVEIYHPEHPLVLEAAGNLIETLNRLGNYCDEERYARVCYDSLTRPLLNPESVEAANAAINLAQASYNLVQENGLSIPDIEEAEMLAKEVVRIIKSLNGPISS